MEKGGIPSSRRFNFSGTDLLGTLFHKAGTCSVQSSYPYPISSFFSRESEGKTPPLFARLLQVRSDAIFRLSDSAEDRLPLFSDFRDGAEFSPGSKPFPILRKLFAYYTYTREGGGGGRGGGGLKREKRGFLVFRAYLVPKVFL